jgi:hypothetical protein
MDDGPMSSKWLKVLRFLAGVDEIVGGYAGMTLTGLNLKKQKQGWFMVVSAKRTGGERVVAYYGGHRPYECLWLFAYEVAHQTVKWRPDKYAKE